MTAEPWAPRSPRSEEPQPPDLARLVRSLSDRADISELIDRYITAFDLLTEEPRDDEWYRSVFTEDGKLTAGLRALGLADPSAKALRDLRRRVGTAPVRRLFEVLAGPLGRPSTPGIMFGGLRTVSFDGCKSIRVPDTGANRAWLGKQNASNGETGYPALSLMALAGTGTRALTGAVFGSQAEGETAWAGKLLHLLDATMLLLMDRGFDGESSWPRSSRRGRSSWSGSNANRRPALGLASLCSGTRTEGNGNLCNRSGSDSVL
jgi:hypothetical protein